MVTVLSDTEFENCWNTVVNREELDLIDYGKTHWACGQLFTLEDIEKNKLNGGWNKLREIINEIENECAVYYFCTTDDTLDSKRLFFVVYGDNAIYHCMEIRAQCNRMRNKTEGLTAQECLEIMNSGYGNRGEVTGSVSVQCPLF